MPQYKDDPDFSKKNLQRDKRLYEGMDKAKEKGVSAEMSAEKRYYGDPKVKRLGKKRYAENMEYMRSENKRRSDKEIEKIESGKPGSRKRTLK